MKKVAMLLTVLSCWFTGFTQERMTKEQARLICAQEMAAFTTAVSGSYKKGISFEQFQFALCGSLKPTAEGSNLIKSAFNYLSQAVSSDAIIKSNDGKAIAYSLNYMLNLHNKKIESDGSEIFGGKTGSANINFSINKEGCQWYQLSCHLQAVANWITAIWTTIQTIQIAIFGPYP